MKEKLLFYFIRNNYCWLPPHKKIIKTEIKLWKIVFVRKIIEQKN